MGITTPEEFHPLIVPLGGYDIESALEPEGQTDIANFHARFGENQADRSINLMMRQYYQQIASLLVQAGIKYDVWDPHVLGLGWVPWCTFAFDTLDVTHPCPTPTLFGGGRARTFEYFTDGVRESPHVLWTFSTGEMLSWPILVRWNDSDVWMEDDEEDDDGGEMEDDDGGGMEIAVLDAQGRLSVLEEMEGKLLWTFKKDDAGPVIAASSDTTAYYLVYPDEHAGFPQFIAFHFNARGKKATPAGSWFPVSLRQEESAEERSNLESERFRTVEYLILTTAVNEPILMLHHPVDAVESSETWENGFPTATRNWHWLCGSFAPDADGKMQFHVFQVPREQQEHEDAVTPLWSSGKLTTEDSSPVRNVPITFWPTRNTPNSE